MKYYIRTEMYRSSRCKLDLRNMTAWSYGWYQLVACIGGKVYFNTASYSHTTSKHQSAVESLLRFHGVKYTPISIKAGLQNLGGEHRNIDDEIEKIKHAMLNPKSRIKKNKQRRVEIKQLENKKIRIEALLSMKRTKHSGYLQNFPPAKVKKRPLRKEKRPLRKEKRPLRKEKRPLKSKPESRTEMPLSTEFRWPTLIQGGVR